MSKAFKSQDANIQTGLGVTRPVAFYLQELKLDPKTFGKSLGKAAADYIEGKYLNVLTDALEGFTGIKVDRTPAERGFLLIFRALLRGTAETVENSLRSLPSKPAQALPLEAIFGQAFADLQLTIDKTFLKRPQDLELLPPFQELVRRWLTDWGVGETAAREVVRQLPTSFAWALQEELRDHLEEYKPFLEAVETKFTPALEYLLAWERYYVHLEKQVFDPMFDESFGIEKVFVPLRAYWEKTIKDGERRGEKDKVVLDLQTALNQWLLAEDKDDAVRVVVGGPGSGKSSSVKVWAAELAQQRDVKVLLIPLYELTGLNDGVDEIVGRWARDGKWFKQNPVMEEERLLLILDGLDEIADAGKISAEVAAKFVGQVMDRIRSRNMRNCQLQILISGRDVVVQQNEERHWKEHQVLRVLPYVVDKNSPDSRTGVFVDPGKLLGTDGREEWWRKFGQVTGEGYQDIPEPLRRNDLQEVTGQPLQGYLVARSFRRKTLQFDDATNLNLIYADLLRDVHDGTHNRRRNLPGLEFEDFSEVLQEIALAIWHGNGRKASVEEIERHCKDRAAESHIESVEENAKKGITRLLLAFYFREQGRNEERDRTFEFTHKSFGEYLTALRLVAEVRDLEEERKVKQRRKKNINQQDELEKLAKVCGPRALDPYIVAFIDRQMQLEDLEAVKAWQKMLCELLEHELEHSFPMEHVALGQPFVEMRRRACNAEEALVVLISACWSATKDKIVVRWPDNYSLADLLRRSERTGVLFSNLVGLELSCSVLYGMDLFAADLSFTVLKDSDLRFANLASATLANSNLGACNLRCAALSHANLSFADLSEATLSYTYSRFANLLGANLSSANLEGANLERANLEGANLEGANLEGANLEGANLEGANLEGAKLRRSQLNGTIGTPASLPGKFLLADKDE